MRVKHPWWSRFVDGFMKNYSREEVAANFFLSGGKCLDLGCGDGELINKYLAERYRKLVGIDISPSLIKEANQRAKDNSKFYISDIEIFLNKMIKKKITFSDVYMLAILEHVFWPHDVLNKVSAIIKRGGRICIEVPNIAWLPYRLRMVFGHFPKTAPTSDVIPGVYDEHIRFYTIASLDKLMSRAGFVRERLSCAGRLPFAKSLLPSLLSPDIVVVYKKI